MTGAEIGDCSREIPPSYNPNELHATLQGGQEAVTEITEE
jgi:hypothetical protein